LVNGASTLNMSGDAQVLHNSSGEIGGGISLGSNLWGPTNILNMNGGLVKENEAGSSGGGIYANGANNNYGANGANGELYVKNVLITDNNSSWEGAGLAACPISKTTIYANNGDKTRELFY
jgi:predicted outer membrane repeat protein